MAILNSEHLLEQAILLVEATPGRRPRQVNLRRAVSSAYYAVFHHVLASVADEFVGRTMRTSARYVLVYRSIDHGTLRNLCSEVLRQQPSPRYARHLPAHGFDPSLRKFASIFLALLSQRHDADYDPSQFLASVETRLAIATAQTAITSYNSASAEGRKSFLTLLVFPPR